MTDKKKARAIIATKSIHNIRLDIELMRREHFNTTRRDPHDTADMVSWLCSMIAIYRAELKRRNRAA